MGGDQSPLILVSTAILGTERMLNKYLSNEWSQLVALMVWPLGTEQDRDLTGVVNIKWHTVLTPQVLSHVHGILCRENTYVEKFKTYIFLIIIHEYEQLNLLMHSYSWVMMYNVHILWKRNLVDGDSLCSFNTYHTKSQLLLTNKRNKLERIVRKGNSKMYTLYIYNHPLAYVFLSLDFRCNYFNVVTSLVYFIWS